MLHHPNSTSDCAFLAEPNPEAMGSQYYKGLAGEGM